MCVVISNVEQWFDLNMTSQDLRVSHCEMSTLEHYMQHLCDATHRDYSRHLFRSKRALASKIVEIFRWSLRGMLGQLTQRAQKFCLPFICDGSFRSFNKAQLEFAMTAAFGAEIFRSLTDTSYNTKACSMARPRLAAPKRRADVRNRISHSTSPVPPKKRKRRAANDNVQCENENWPQQVTDDVKIKCMRDYFTNSMWQQQPVCAVCARDRVPGMTYQLKQNDKLPSAFRTFLDVPCHSVLCGKDEFVFGHVALDNMMLCRQGIESSDSSVFKVHVCEDCYGCLDPKSAKRKAPATLPKFSLANKLYLGKLPDRFKDITWVEEQVCALYRSTVFVYRLYHSDNPQDPYMAKGNSCAHPQNTVSTAKVLPRTPADVAGCISVVFTGPNKTVPKAALKNVFRVRKNVVRDFLEWLRVNNPMYKDIAIDETHLSMYGDDGADIALPGIDDRVIVNENSHADADFAAETSAFEPHPANDDQPANAEVRKDVFIEHTGTYDADNTMMPVRRSLAAGMRNLNKPANTPDIVIPRGSEPIPEYNNPTLFPGMFPTLFPYGLGGFDDNTRDIPISFQKHVEYLLDIADRRFRYHRSFLFVTLNIHQRRTAHLHTWLTVKKSRFAHIAPKLATISAERLKRVANHIEKDGKISELSPQDQEVMVLMREVTAVSSNIPGSSASKLRVRNEIRAYMGYFGLPHLYITMNPNAKHSPIFQVMWGDDAVDLAARFPDLVDSVERGKRVASDPVTGADFFEFSLDCFFRDLLGWDKTKQTSRPEGGIFGKIRAYYGTAEFTERGQLHGHFLIWLDGGLNPTEVHEKMRNDINWKQQFFEYFEDIIKHELPETCDDIEPGYEPRAQRPPNPDSPDFAREFVAEVKKMGECLQRHPSPCKPVCHKYGSQDCRFGFPHDIIEKSDFVPDTNSILLRSRDPTINWYNPIILTSCRHNHDIKCILSGKSAKAAMFYISDYITKNDEKMWELLSMFSRTVAANPAQDAGLSEKDSARKLLHQCLATIIREQKIHGQQAARYLRGAGDGMCTHNTVPMYSHAITSHVQKMVSPTEDANHTTLHPTLNHHHSSQMRMDDDGDMDEAGEDAEFEVEPITFEGEGPGDNKLEDEDGDGDGGDDDDGATQVRLTKDGTPSFQSDQAHDYLHRDELLEDICFYDYVRCYKKVLSVKAGGRVKEDGNYPRFRLCTPHPQAQSHLLLQMIDPDWARPNKEIVPRVVGCSIPRREKDDTYFATFMLAHFLPFSARNPVKLLGTSAIEFFHSADFSARSRNVIKNWAAIHECEDQRDSERLRKHQTKVKKSKEISRALRGQIPDDYFDSPDAYVVADSPPSLEQLDPATAYMRAALAGANWFQNTPTTASQADSILYDSTLPNPIGIYRDQLKHWEHQVKVKANEAAARRRSQLDPSRQNAVVQAPESVQGTQPVPTYSSQARESGPPPQTRAYAHDAIHTESFDDRVARIIRSQGLNPAQQRAFEICAAKFREILENEAAGIDTWEPLRMFLTGPGGTGKTYVVNCLKMLMEEYGQAHCIRFLAPTGAAARLIGGQTIHSGIGLKVAERRDDLGREDWDLQATISPTKKAELTAEWKNAKFVFLDEVSMMGQDLMCELDGVLRMVRHRPDDWFGGINIICSGDLCQYEPVAKRAVFMPVPKSSPRGKKKDSMEAKSRQGRMAWKQFNTVIELTEQKRMKDDPEYAAAVLRYRERKCTLDDVDLFNSRLIQSLENPNGVDLSLPRYRDAAAIVSRNRTRQVLNLEKAWAKTSGPNAPRLISCHAKHTSNGRKEVPADIHKHFLEVESTSDNNKIRPPVLDLYIGAPVIIRQGNISVELGVTTGAQGFVRGLELEQLESGDMHASLAIVEFPDADFQLDGLPKNHFPIKAVSGRITQVMRKKIDNARWRMEATRYQLAFELGFAVTGHSAQGKTMDCVVCDLNSLDGGGYVAASRARTREGLVITRPVTLQVLNRPLKHELVFELRRLNVLSHNTLVRHGYLDEPLLNVPDFEIEKDLPETTKFHIDVADPAETATKRKQSKKIRAPADVAMASTSTRVTRSKARMLPSPQHTPEAQLPTVPPGSCPKKRPCDASEPRNPHAAKRNRTARCS